MNSTNKLSKKEIKECVWEICKFWILQTTCTYCRKIHGFERYVNFEFYKHKDTVYDDTPLFERYVNFEFYKQMAETKTSEARLRDM